MLKTPTETNPYLRSHEIVQVIVMMFNESGFSNKTLYFHDAVVIRNS